MQKMFEGVAPVLLPTDTLWLSSVTPSSEGQLISNQLQLSRARRREPYLEPSARSTAYSMRKAFNSLIGKIRSEHVMVFRAA